MKEDISKIQTNIIVERKQSRPIRPPLVKIQWNLYKADTLKADTSIKRTVWRGTDCFAFRPNDLRKNLYKVDISIKRTHFLHQWCPFYRDSTVLFIVIF